MNKRLAGAFWEEAAAQYLQRQGVRMVARNYRCSRGEIDMIGYHLGCLCFFEVKYRKDDGFGHALESVDGRKQKTICRCADIYLYRHHIVQEQPVRFDVVAVCGTDIRWVQNAFDYQRGKG